MSVRDRIAAGSLRPLAAFWLLGSFWGSWVALLPDVARAARVTDGPLGLAMVCTICGAFPAMVVAARAGNQRGVPWLAPACVAFGLCGALVALAPGFPWLIAALVAMGASSGMVDVLMNSAVSQFETVGGRRRMHLAHSLYSAGLCVAAVSSGLLREAGAGYRQVLLGWSVLIVLGSVLTRGARGRPAAPPAPRRPAPALPSWRLLVLGLVLAMSLLVENGMELWSALHLERDLGASPAVAGLGPGLLALAAVIGRLGGQAITTRLGDTGLVVASGLASAAGVAGFALAPSWPLALPALLLAGGGVSLAFPTVIGLAGRLARSGEQGSAVGAVAQVSYLGFLVSPVLLGQLSAQFGLRDALLSLSLAALAFSGGGGALVAALTRRGVALAAVRP